MKAIREQDDGSCVYTHDQPFILKNDQAIAPLELVYETWGTLHQDKNNVVLVHHALSVGSHVNSHSKNQESGWWEGMIGPNKAIDTLKYFVICINNLGSCFGSSGPKSINRKTGKPYHSNFPGITILDMVHSQKILLDVLGIHQIHSIIGNSMGGMLSLTWAIEYPSTVTKVMLTSSCYKAYPSNIASRSIQEQAIQMDPLWQDGDYENNESLSGFRLARKLGLYSYRNSSEWNRRFNSNNGRVPKDTDIMEYLDYNAEKFCSSFDANSYLVLTRAMNLFDVTEKYASLESAFLRILAQILVVSVESDVLYAPQQQKELYAVLKQSGVNSNFINHRSKYGHDAFLVEKESFTKYITSFLESLQLVTHIDID